MCLEHFKLGSLITFSSQNEDIARLILIIAGKANMRMCRQPSDSEMTYKSQQGSVQSKWFNAGEDSTLELMQAFAELSSGFVAQVVSELFVASLSRIALQQMKKQEPLVALWFIEMTALELALVALDHEKTRCSDQRGAQHAKPYRGRKRRNCAGPTLKLDAR
jgi:hypothetical protein